MMTASARSVTGKLVERASQPFEMAALVDDGASPHLAHFVDAVGELIAAIFDTDQGVTRRQITAVHIGNARQGHLPCRSRT
jgi:hypothetical protein